MSLFHFKLGNKFLISPIVLFLFLIFILREKKLYFNNTTLLLFIFVIYSFFTSLFSHYKYDGILASYFIFLLLLFHIFLLNYKIDIYKFIFFLSFINSVFSYFEFFAKSLGIYKVIVIPYIFIISGIDSIGGFFFQPNHNALLMNFGILLSIYYYIKSEKNINRLYYFIIFLFFVIGLNLTSSRAGMLSSSITILYLIFFKNIDKKMVGYLFLIYILTSLFSYYYFGYTSLDKFVDKGEPNIYSVESRFMIWLASILMWKNNPIFGVGLENFKFLNAPYQVEALDILHLPTTNLGNYVWAHSEVLQLLAELGIVGILIVFVPYLLFFRKVHKVDSENSYEIIIKSAILFMIFIHSSFSWELRHPFFMFLLVMVITAFPEDISCITGSKKNIILFLSICLLILSSSFFYYNVKDSLRYSFFHNKKESAILDSLDNPYLFWIASAFYLDNKTPNILKLRYGSDSVPTFKEDILHLKDVRRVSQEEFNRYLAISEKLYKLHKYWVTNYYYSIALMLDNRFDESIKIAREGLKINPNANELFFIWHLNNIHLHAKKNGKDIKDFLPSKNDEFFKNHNKMELKVGLGG